MCYGPLSFRPFIGKRVISRLALVGCCLVTSVMLAAAEIIESESSHKQGVYQINLVVVLDALFEDVHHVITDYRHMYRLNPAIVESEVMSTPDGSDVLVRTLIDDCIMVFCWEILRVEDVQEMEIGDIYAVIVPELSNVRSGSTKLVIEPVGSKTLINYHALLEPGLFVPPIIGSYLVKKKLYEVALNTFRNVERVARIRNVNQEAQRALTAQGK